jgi:hypothetical protein
MSAYAQGVVPDNLACLRPIVEAVPSTCNGKIRERTRGASHADGVDPDLSLIRRHGPCSLKWFEGRGFREGLELMAVQADR